MYLINSSGVKSLKDEGVFFLKYNNDDISSFIFLSIEGSSKNSVANIYLTLS